MFLGIITLLVILGLIYLIFHSVSTSVNKVLYAIQETDEPYHDTKENNP